MCRLLSTFDIPTFLIVIIDPISVSRPVPLLIFCHWLFRNIGGVMFGILRYCLITAKNTNAWRFTTGLPTLPWYIGELCLDAYPFLKARAVAKERFWLNLLCFIGFVPLVLAKFSMIIFRYYYVINAIDNNAYFTAQGVADASVLAITAWSDLLNSIVIVYAGTETKKVVKNSFLSNIVRTTELRIVVCTMLTILAVVLTIIDSCHFDPSVNGECRFKGVRDIAVTYVYSLYLMDYLLIKYYRVLQTEKIGRGATRRPLDKPAITPASWPVFGLARNPSLTFGGQSTQQFDSWTGTGTGTELDTPSFQMLERDIKYNNEGGSSVYQRSQTHISNLDSVILEELSERESGESEQVHQSPENSDDDHLVWPSSSSHLNDKTEQYRQVHSNLQTRENKIFRPLHRFIPKR
ncbi:hypothetical protein HK096_002223 [Nowakowskiella sp. JEL0078]|nr:hypothetical protein HK096_002223 [Nowakowskiella sp. JEL0078]